ncbi:MULTISPECIES: hypothetical protein [unclassified Burkholderia]|nr:MULTISPECIES: hypothetical protein [unclassified Burkholderia]
MNIWQFMADHPVLTVILAIVGATTIEAVANAVAVIIVRRRK